MPGRPRFPFRRLARDECRGRCGAGDGGRRVRRARIRPAATGLQPWHEGDSLDLAAASRSSPARTAAAPPLRFDPLALWTGRRPLGNQGAIGPARGGARTAPRACPNQRGQGRCRGVTQHGRCRPEAGQGRSNKKGACRVRGRGRCSRVRGRVQFRDGRLPRGIAGGPPDRSRPCGGCTG
jgi:hypothetical protein